MTGSSWSVADGPILVLSPHLDDAVLSAFALVRSGAEVMTLFDGAPDPPVQTSWDRLCGFADSAEAVLARRAENTAAFVGVDVVQHSLGLLDEQYHAGPRPRSDRDVIVAAVRKWTADRSAARVTVAVTAGAGRLLTPSAAGSGPRSSRRKEIRRMVGPAGRALLDARARFVVPRTAPIAHEDHVLARDAILEALPTLGVGSLLLYEELPYLWGAPADESVRLLSQQTRLPARGFSLPVDRAEKARRIGGYTSQLRYMHSPSGPLDRAQSLPPQERYWLLTQALEAPFDS